MFYGNNAQDTRQLFFSSWQKYRQKQPLESLEQQIVDVILDHPEYHALLDNFTTQHDQAYYPELGQTNPFLHMGLHLAIRDQISTDRPVGIISVYQTLLKKLHDPMAVEHLMMEQLAECLWQAQRNQSIPDETHYLNELKQLS